MKVTLLSFDIEEWFQVENMRGAIRHDEWDTIDSTVEKNTGRILELLDRHGIKATFFILGIIAERHPDLIRRIAASDHELASHGFHHELNTTYNGDLLRDDLKNSKNLLEDLTGEKVVGYRAPSFSVTDEVVDLLKGLGYIYDSSYNPFNLNTRYGTITKKMDKIDGVLRIENGLYEIPLSQTKLGSQTLPISGGAYFRLIPAPVFNRLVKNYLKVNQTYNFYLHPWEFEPEQPRIRNIPLNYRIRHYTGLSKTAKKLDHLIRMLKDQKCSFSTMRNYIAQLDQSLFC